MSLVDEVKTRLDIVEVVSSYTSLQKAGRNFKAPCPFHTERTPSFIVSPERQSWHCFGACSTGGDLISFVMRREGLEFGEALRTLAATAGITVTTSVIQTKSATTYEINDAAATFYELLLYSETGKETRDYLKVRGVDKATARKFRLGLSPSAATVDSLREHLLAEGYTVEQMVEAGLSRPSKEGVARDFFRGRLMFPIANRRGRIAGFGARALGDSEPKYINTAGTDVFDKQAMLYGLNLASDAIRVRGAVVVVEGYMDVIAAHKHDHANVVASMGTALTDAQVTQLRSLADSVVLALDADAAGQEATVRKLEEMLVRAAQQESTAFSRRVGPIMRKDQIEIKIATLPDGSDPDDLIRHNPDEWSRIVETAVPGPEFMIRWLPNKFDLSSGSGKTAAAELVEGLIYAANPFDQERYTNELAEVLGVHQDRLEPILREIGRRRATTRSRSGRPKPPAPATVDRSFGQNSPKIVDDYALAILVQKPNLREMAAKFPPECFQRSEDREIFTQWLTVVTMDELRSVLDPALHDRLEELSTTALEPTVLGQSESALQQILARIEERHLRLLQDGLLSGEQPFEASHDIEQAIINVNKRLKDIHSRRG